MDTKKPLGFFMASIIEVATNTSEVFFFTVTLAINFGVARFLADMMSDLKEQIRRFYMNNENQAKYSNRFREIIQFHCDAREFSRRDIFF